MICLPVLGMYRCIFEGQLPCGVIIKTLPGRSRLFGFSGSLVFLFVLRTTFLVFKVAKSDIAYTA
jgi:hypothetical protein